MMSEYDNLETICEILEEYIESNWYTALSLFIDGPLHNVLKGDSLELDWDKGYFATRIATRMGRGEWLIRNEGKIFKLYSYSPLSLNLRYKEDYDHKSLVDLPLELNFSLIHRLVEIMHLDISDRTLDTAMKDRNTMVFLIGLPMYKILEVIEQRNWLKRRMAALKNFKGI